MPEYEYQRRMNFMNFTARFIPTRNFFLFNKASIRKLNEEYDQFVAGSDQIWNPHFWPPKREKAYFQQYLLEFANPDKRSALSASIGTDELPKRWEAPFRAEWKKFKSISVRENAAARILRQTGGFDVPVLLDPTLALSPEEWEKVLNPDIADGFPKEYALLYFLGDRPDAYRIFADEAAKSRGLELMELNHPGIPEYASFGPSEFLSAVKQASIVLTDSFHAVVFSIIFQKPFVIFERKEQGMCSMWSRFETLFGKLGISGRTYGSIRPEDSFCFDYGAINQELEKERRKIREYVRQICR